jgi:cell division protein FtsW
MLRIDRTNTGFIGQWWWTVDRIMLAAIGTLMAFGALLVMASSHAVAERIGVDPFYFVHRQLLFMLIGVGVLVGVSLMDKVLVRRFAIIGFLAVFILLMLVPIVGTEVNGAQRWLNLGLTIQPSEIAKPFFVVVTAWVLALNNIRTHFKGYWVAVGLYVLLATLLVMQPDIGMTIMVSIVWGAQLFISGIPMWVVGGIGGLGLAAIVLAYFLFGHVRNRIDSFLDPATGDNYQTGKSLEAFGRGGFLGTGPGEGEVKGILPDSHTDFVFAVAGEELGILVSIVMVSIYAFIVIRGFLKLLNEKDLFTIYATAGLLILFGFQAIINMGVSLNMLPNTGMTLPFISYGGSSMVSMAMTMGMVLALTRRRYGAVHS